MLGQLHLELFCFCKKIDNMLADQLAPAFEIERNFLFKSGNENDLGDASFFLQFADSCLLPGFSWLNSALGKIPVSSSILEEKKIKTRAIKMT